MKNKRRILNFGAYLIFLIIFTIPYLNWERKNKVHSDFRVIERESFKIASLNNPDFLDSLLLLEKQVNEFTLRNPIPENIALGDYLSTTDTSFRSINELHSDFIDKINNIDDFYRKSERKSKHLVFLFFLIGNLVFWIMTHYIKKLVH